MTTIRFFCVAAILLVANATVAVAQTTKALDVRLRETLSEKLPEWKPADVAHPFAQNMPSNGSPMFYGIWKDGERKLDIYVTLAGPQNEIDEQFHSFFLRQIMPASHAVSGIGSRAVLVETARTVEIGFSKENVFVHALYEFPAQHGKTPYYYLPAPKHEIARLIEIARILAPVIDSPKSAIACRNDFFDTSIKPPVTDGERLLDAASKGDSHTIQNLLTSGVKPDVADAEGNTPLHLAVNIGCADAVDVILKAKPDLDARNHDEETPLLIAAAYADIGLMQRLLRAGADLNAKDRHGRNAAFMALARANRSFFIMRSVTREDQLTALGFLKNAGLDLNARTIRGDTLLTNDLFSYGVQGELIKQLVNAGVDINGRGSSEQTVLIKVVQGSVPKDRDPLIRLLLDLGADPSLKDDRGQTAMDYLLLDKQHRTSPEDQKFIGETIKLLSGGAGGK